MFINNDYIRQNLQYIISGVFKLWQDHKKHSKSSVKRSEWKKEIEEREVRIEKTMKKWRDRLVKCPRK